MAQTEKSELEKRLFDVNVTIHTIDDRCGVCNLKLMEVRNKKTNFLIEIICPSCIDNDNSYLLDE